MQSQHIRTYNHTWFVNEFIKQNKFVTPREEAKEYVIDTLIKTKFLRNCEEFHKAFDDDNYETLAVYFWLDVSDDEKWEAIFYADDKYQKKIIPLLLKISLTTDQDALFDFRDQFKACLREYYRDKIDQFIEEVFYNDFYNFVDDRGFDE
jgi:hypothetical protein